MIVGFFTISRKQKLTEKSYLLNFIFALVMAYVLNKFLGYKGAHTILEGMEIGFISWLGFILPVLLTQQVFEQRDKKTVFLYAGYQLVSLLIMGGVITFLS